MSVTFIKLGVMLESTRNAVPHAQQREWFEQERIKADRSTFY